MDGSSFDRMVRVLATLPTRRAVLRRLIGVPLGAVLAIPDRGVGTEARGRKARRHLAHRQQRRATTQRSRRRDRAAGAEACIPTGKQCPSKKPRGRKGKKLSCAQCCQDLVVTDADGTRVCGCLPNGRSCIETTSCCSGICQSGTCQAAPCSVGGACSCDGTSCAGCCAGTGCVAVEAQTDTQCGTGTAGAACTACSGTVCVSGRCQPCSVANPCSGGLVCCGAPGSCVDTDTDETNCGTLRDCLRRIHAGLLERELRYLRRRL